MIVYTDNKVLCGIGENTLKNINKFTERPESLDGPEMDMLYEYAKLTSFGSNDLLNIHRCLMNENDRIMYECQTREKNIREGREEGLKIGREEGKALGLAEGRAEGQMEGKTETARNLKKLGVDRDTISKATGLTIETIEKL